SLALGERVSAGQERGQLQDMTEITLTRKSSFRETLKQIFNPLPEVEGKLAFTLAEVLITLGIIGIVAALTLPAFISNVQGRIQAKRVENINQKLSKVTDKMAVQSGLIGYPDTMAFVQEMKKHMSIAKVCDNSHLAECWGTTEVDVGKDKPWEISKTKTAKTLKIGEPDSWADTVGIVTADGTPMILSYDKNCNFDPNNAGLQYNQSSGKSNSLACLSGVFDWNGGARPNKLGDDVITLGMASGLGSSCAFEVGSTCYTAPFTPKPMTKAECEAAVAEGKLGIKGCYYAQDYWAGAVKQCGGVSKMPTMAQLGELASQLYVGNPSIGAYENKSGIQFDSNSLTAKSIGLAPRFNIWSNKEDSSIGAHYRYFRNSSSGWAKGSRRGNSNFNAICIIN
ncbi:MAG: type II secretion system GspH family protein, partial [Brachyspira sp.]|nr:type II secretion system GspH family protein [Brachyspira sp.]